MDKKAKAFGTFNLIMHTEEMKLAGLGQGSFAVKIKTSDEIPLTL